MEDCRKFTPVVMRTPNEWYFIGICQNCGVVVSSIIDGGTALKELDNKHKEVEHT